MIDIHRQERSKKISSGELAMEKQISATFDKFSFLEIPVQTCIDVPAKLANAVFTSNSSRLSVSLATT
ncbi:MAG: hypothetical protein OXI01_14055 [Albidovulum sp.]|nr:hypothetical protein [Albidovulum sp.]